MAVYLARNRLWPAMGYKPHAGQHEVHSSTVRNRVVAGGRRAGKSNIGGMELVPEAMFTYTARNELFEQGKRREFWVVGPEYSDSEKEFRIFWNTARRLQMPMDKPGSYNNPQTGDMQVSMWGGLFQLHAKSAKYPDQLVGEGLSGVVLAEAAKLKEVVWTKFIRPALADFKGWSLLVSTPEGRNWFYKRWQTGQDPARPAWASWRMPAWINPYVYPLGATQAAVDKIMRAIEERTFTEELGEQLGVDPEVVQLILDMTPDSFNQEIAALFTEFVGRVFKEWDEEVHVTDLQYDPKLPLFLATDHGWTNPFVALWVQKDVWDNVYVLDEYRETQRDINDIARDLLEHPLNRGIHTLYPDPAEPGEANVLVNKLKCTLNGDTGGELRDRIKYIRTWLKPVPPHIPPEQRKPKLMIDRKCAGLIGEMGTYRYPERRNDSGPAPEKPMDKDDHGPEALGRFFRGHYGPLEATGTIAHARISKVTVRR